MVRIRKWFKNKFLRRKWLRNLFLQFFRNLASITVPALVTDDITGPAHISDDVTVPAPFSDDVTGHVPCSDDVTIPADFSDDVTGHASFSDDVIPSLFGILLSSSLHVREIVFSQCSVLELAQLGCASKAARAMSLAEMGRRKLDVSVIMTKLPGTALLEKTVLKIKDRYGPTLSRIGPTVSRSKTEMQHQKFATILYPLLAHSRIGMLDIQEVDEAKCTFTELFLKSGLVSYSKQPFYVDTFRIPNCAGALPLLNFILATRVFLTKSRGYSNPPDYSYTFRAMMEADYVELETEEDSEDYPRNPINNLMAPNIIVREGCRIEKEMLSLMIRQWQSGHRSVATFAATIAMIEPGDYFDQITPDGDVNDDEFARNMRDSTAGSTEIPYPQDDVIPPSVCLQMNKMEKYYTKNDNKSQAFRIVRDLDNISLVVLAKVVKTKTVAVGMFQQM